MAKQTTVTLIDDLDGSVAEEQVEFAVDGRSYEIDLSAANSARLRDLLAPFVTAARAERQHYLIGEIAPRLEQRVIEEYDVPN